MNQEQQSTGSQQVSPEGSCTVERAEQLKESLLTALQNGNGLVLDFSGITGCDLTFVQLLCAVAKKADSQGKKVVSNTAMPQSVIDLAGRLGLYYSCSQCNTQSCVLKEVCSYE